MGMLITRYGARTENSLTQVARIEEAQRQVDAQNAAAEAEEKAQAEAEELANLEEATKPGKGRK